VALAQGNRVGDDIHQIVVDWVNYLRREKLWGLDDPLFPAAKIVVGDSWHFEAPGLDRKHWSSPGPIRQIFKDAFAAAGLSYFNPHSFRKTLALLGGQICKSPEEYKASHHSGPLEVELTGRNIPFVKFGGLKFLEADPGGGKR